MYDSIFRRDMCRDERFLLFDSHVERGLRWMETEKGEKEKEE